MIKLSFIRGSALRRVFIDGRKISFLTGELNNVPMTIDLDKLDEQKDKIKKMKLDKKELEVLSKLKTEEDIAADIDYDFKQSGWRMIQDGNK